MLKNVTEQYKNLKFLKIKADFFLHLDLCLHFEINWNDAMVLIHAF